MILSKNFRFILKRFRLSTLLNILGMSVAFAAFMIIIMQVWHDRTYNSPIKDHDKIFMAYSTDKEKTKYTYISLLWCEKIKEISPHAKDYTFLGYSDPKTTLCIGKDQYTTGKITTVSSNYLSFFNFQMIVGGSDCLNEYNAVAVPESFALKYFGTTDVIGKTIDREQETYINGVYKDFPGNCFIKNDIYQQFYISPELKENWEYNSLTMFLKTDSPAAITEIQKSINAFLSDYNKNNPYAFRQSFAFVPLNELHTTHGIEGSPDVPINTSTELILISIAIAIILIASINYVNFANSLMPVRLQSINTQKILGATVRSLRGALILESIAICLLSFVIAIGLSAVLNTTSLATLTEAGMSPIDNYQSLLLTFGVAILVGFVAGAIPAVRATSYSPAVALKGNFGLSPSGKVIRTTVVGLQFFISAVLIIGACYMQLQRQYLTRSADYGFAKDELVVCDTNYPAQLPDHNTVSEAVRKLPFVSSVTFSWSTLGEDSNTQGWVFKDVNGDPVDPRTLFGETDYLKTMGIRLIEGRDFAPTDSAAIIVNQHTRDKYPETVGVGKYMSFGDTQYEIVGICENAKFSTLSKATEPILIIKMPGFPCNILNVRVEKGANMFASMKEIQKTLDQFDPGYPFETQLYDQILDATYQKESKLSTQITIFSALAIFISIIGVFGLVMFDSEYRKREIAIRKVFGATTSGILKMFNLRYLTILLVSFIAAVPVVWLIIGKWLENFAYKIEMEWWVIIAVFIVLAAITVATVTCQCLRIARSKPVESLKSE